MELHKKELSHMCTQSQCNRSFSTDFDLQRHKAQENHRGGKDFECALCGRKYSTSQGLNDHARDAHKGGKKIESSFKE